MKLKEHTFNLVFKRDGEVVGSQVVYSSTISEVYNQSKKYLSAYKSDEVLGFIFDEEENNYKKIEL